MTKPKGRPKGKKDFSKQDVENIWEIVQPRLKFRDTNAELLERLEDAGFNIGMTKFIEIKNNCRKRIGDRFKEIGEIELAQEHQQSIDTMKYLLKIQMKNLEDAQSNGDKDTDKINRIIKSIIDIEEALLGYYGNQDVIDAVFKHFDDEKRERDEQEAEIISQKIKLKEK